MANLTYTQLLYIEELFLNRGYVLDFSTPDFDRFTLESVGISLCKQYGVSKGKSLQKFWCETTNHDASKLLNDLLDYYNQNYSERDIFNKKAYDICRKIAYDLPLQESHSALKIQADIFAKAFDSHYIEKQVESMYKAIEEHPSDSIGKSKGLLETCCKTILEKNIVPIDKNWSVQQLMKETCKTLKLTPDSIDNSAKAYDTIKQLLGNLAAISGSMAELRNSYGSGHGKSAFYSGLSPRHAKLAVGAAVTAVNFLWDTYKIRN